MARLSHPNVVRVFDVGEVDGDLFIAMEFIRGVTLRSWLSGQVRSWPEIRAVFVAAGQGLAAAHREGVVHRDFTPENVIIDDDGRARVVDFGLAAASGEELMPGHTADEDELVDTAQTTDPTPGGTPAYIAPELHLGRPADARSDQFSFCVALYEGVYGERPFTGKTHHELRANVLTAALRDPPPGRKVPAWLRKVLLRGLRVAPDERFPDMLSLLAALDADPGRTRRRALAGLTLVALDHPEALGPEAMVLIESAVEEILGLDRAELRRIA